MGRPVAKPPDGAGRGMQMNEGLTIRTDGFR
jgi:hypothetical protein